MTRFQILVYEDDEHPPVRVDAGRSYQEAKRFLDGVWKGVKAPIVSLWDSERKEFRWAYTPHQPEGFAPCEEFRVLIT